jgi:phage terminase large subunit
VAVDGEARLVPLAEDVYRPHGAARKLFDCKAPEILLDGPAGTGKTFAVLHYVDWLCEEYPGLRVLFVRQTRESLTHSVLGSTFEPKVLGPDHPILRGGGTAEHRSSYRYPNGSIIVLAGLDKPGRTFSAEYDVVCAFEAWELSLKTWELLFRTLRSNRLPWQQMIADTNPAHERHWLIVRALRGNMVRLKSVHADNPSLTPEYLGRLSSMTGPRRARLYLGEWVGEQGQVWEVFDPAIHIVPPIDLTTCRWFFGAVDWGWRDTGVLQVWGVVPGKTRDLDRMYRVAEIYQTGRLLDWWAERAVEMHREYGLAAIVCDPSRPENIAKFNDMLGSPRGREVARIARKANNQRRSKKDMGGLDLVRWALDPKVPGGPRMFFVRDALLYGRDPVRDEVGQPCCTEEEIPSYVFREDEEGKPTPEETDDACQDDGCDCTRYAASFMWRRNLEKPEEPAPWAPGTVGAIFDIPRDYVEE